MDWPPMATLPLLLTDSDLKGSNLPPSDLPPSDFSESPSGFLSGGLDAGAAARNAGSASARATPRKAPILNRFIILVQMRFCVCPGHFNGSQHVKELVDSLNVEARL